MQQNDQTYTFPTTFDQSPRRGDDRRAQRRLVPVGGGGDPPGAAEVQRAADAQRQHADLHEDQFAANGISFISDSRLNGPTSAAVQIVGSTTDPDAVITGDYTLLVDIKAEGGNPFPNSTPGPGYLDVQATYHIPNPTFGPIGSITPSAPQLSTASPSGTSRRP